MTLLTAVTLSRNDETSPLAWGIVLGETVEHWTWFITYLMETFLLMKNPSMVMMSNCNKRLKVVVAQFALAALHRH